MTRILKFIIASIQAWAIFCFWLFAWSILFDELHQLRRRPFPMVAA